jgi:hypothetical protein
VRAFNLPSVFVVTKGGLGNQLFQISISHYLSSALQMNVVHLEPHLPKIRRTGRDGIDVWPSYVDELTEFRVICRTSSQVLASLSAKFLTADALLGKFRRRLNRRFDKWLNYDLPTIEFDALLPSGPRWINYSGSSLIGAAHSRELIIEALERICFEHESCRSLKSLALKSQPIIVHWRRGDYVGLEDIYGNLTSDYYNQSIENLSDGSRPVWLITDAVGEEASKLAESVHAQQVFDGTAEFGAVCLLNLMRRHVGLVCSNSTFSWWAAFLSNGAIAHPSEYLDCQVNIFRDLPLVLE